MSYRVCETLGFVLPSSASLFACCIACELVAGSKTSPLPTEAEGGEGKEKWVIIYTTPTVCQALSGFCTDDLFYYEDDLIASPPQPFEMSMHDHCFDR